MSSSARWLLPMALVVVAPASAFGQLSFVTLAALQNGLGPPFLLTNPGVQREIHLTEDQRDKLRTIVKDVADKYQPDLEKAASDGNKKKLLLVGYKCFREMSDKVNKALPDILQPEQIKRLKQIELQVNGIISLNKPEIQKKLDFTDKQKEEIKEIGDRFKRDVLKIVNDTSDALPQGRPLVRARMVLGAVRTVRVKGEVATDKAFAKLTAEQKKTWKEMTGANFDFRFELPFGPRARP